MTPAYAPSTRTARAFTLVELLVVIGIIALLVSVLLPALNSAREQGNAVRCASNLRQLATALVNYAAENKGKFPPNINTLIPAPPSDQPSANLWYDVDRLGKYMPKGTQPSATSTNPTIGGLVMICPSDLENAQRSYAMNIWASSQVDQFVHNKSPQRLTYAGGTYTPAPPFRGELFSAATKGSGNLILLSEAHARNTVPAGFYANSSIGFQGDKPGLRFLGIPGYTTGAGAFGGPAFPYFLANTELAYYKHRKTGQKSLSGNTAVGRVNIAFADSHVELLAHDDMADTQTRLSRLRALWSPYDRQINN